MKSFLCFYDENVDEIETAKDEWINRVSRSLWSERSITPFYINYILFNSIIELK